MLWSAQNLKSAESGGAGEPPPHAPTGRVENWRGTLWVRFQFPPRQTQHADFPHYAYSVNFIQKFVGPIEPAALSGPVISNSIITIQSQSFIKPGPTPSVPAEATAFPRMHQMTSDLFHHPVFDIPKALTGVSDPKIVDPSPENRVNQVYNPICWL
jgi:hypothetical protein